MSPGTSITVIRIAVMDSTTVHVRQAFVAAQKTARRWAVPGCSTMHHRHASSTINASGPVNVAQLHNSTANSTAGRNSPGTQAAAVDCGISMMPVVLIDNSRDIRCLRKRRAASAVRFMSQTTEQITCLASLKPADQKADDSCSN